MGIIDKLISITPFHKRYQESKRRKVQKFIEQQEARHLPKKIELYNQFIKEGDLVFDVGANVGNRISAFLACNAKVVAVEPQPDCVKTLYQKFGNNIIIEQYGLSDENGELEMHISTDSTISSFSSEFIKNTQTRFKYSKWNNTIKVPVITLDSLIEKYGIPMFCKIDVEGFELNVLKGLNYPIPFLSFEYCVPEMSQNMMACIDRLHQIVPNGLFNFSIEETMAFASDTWMSYSEFTELVKQKQFINTLFGDVYFKTSNNV